MNFSTKLILTLTLTAGLVAFPSYSEAQSSCSNADALSQCLRPAIQDCRDAAGCSDNRDTALSLSDFNDDHGCCSPGTSTKKAKKCFKKAASKLGRAAALGGPLVRGLLRNGRNEFLTLSKSSDPCSAGSIAGL